MRIFLRGLTLTAVLLSTCSSYAADEYDHSYVGDSIAEYYGEDNPFGNEAFPKSEVAVNETAKNETAKNETAKNETAKNETAVNETAKNDADGEVQQVSASVHIGDEPLTAPESVQAASMQSPTTPTYRPAGLHSPQPETTYSSSPCESGCATSCEVACDSSGEACGAFGALMRGKSNNIWMQAEALLWFPQARTSAPLAVITDPNEFPLVTADSAVTIGEEFGNNLSPGIRLDGGKYFGDGKVGIGGRFWYMSEDEDDFALASNGVSESLGIPFFNTGSDALNPIVDSAAGEDAVLIGFQNGGVPGFIGEVNGQSSLDIMAAEAYGRVSLVRCQSFSLELIGGYSHFGIDDDLSLNAQFARNPGSGSGTTFRDRFSASNDFHGGQIGAETILRRGRFVARSLTKVHLGNMAQQVDVSGEATNFDAAGFVTPFGTGLFAGGLNGTYDEDRFAFAPEMNLKLGYRFREHVTFTVGYSFLYWSSVALAGEQVDRNLAFTAAGVADREFTMKRDGFWVQGIDLGTTIEF